jgi:hypothetical protein
MLLIAFPLLEWNGIEFISFIQFTSILYKLTGTRYGTFFMCPPGKKIVRDHTHRLEPICRGYNAYMTYGFADVPDLQTRPVQTQLLLMHYGTQDRIKVAAEYDQRPCFRLGAARVRSLEYKKTSGSPNGMRVGGGGEGEVSGEGGVGGGGGVHLYNDSNLN